jgi:hypothetical protein
MNLVAGWRMPVLTPALSMDMDRLAAYSSGGSTHRRKRGDNDCQGRR